jgi:hypothetical protein
MHALTNTCALAVSAALSVGLIASALNNDRIPTHAASIAALNDAVGDYRLDASLDANTLSKGAVVTLLRHGGAGYALALPGASGALSAVRLAIETDQAGEPVLILSRNDRSVRAHRIEAQS